MKTFRGEIDWRLAARALAATDWQRSGAADGELRYACPGVVVSISRQDVSIWAEPGRLTLVAGSPRLQAAAEHRGDGGSMAAEIHRHLVSHGPSAVARLRGHFSLVHVDVQKRIVQLAVDRFAVHPLCYGAAEERFAFSDRADGICLPHGVRIDPQAIFDYLYFHVIPAPRTVFAGVRRMDAAECLVATPDGVRLSRHWSPRFDECIRASLPQLKDEFRDIVQRAVARDALGPVTVGSFLSGGTDSSTVAGMLGIASGAPARTYSIGFEAEGYDEMAYARIAARHFRTDHHEYYVTPADLVSAIPQVAAHYDQPFGNSSAVPAFVCASVARADGVGKLLAGDGGDELFGGNTRYAKQKVFAAYQEIPGVVRRALLEPTLLRTPLGALPVARKAASYVRQARVPMPERMNTYNLLMRLGVGHVLQPAFLEQVDVGDPARQEKAVYERCTDGSLVNRMLAYDWKYTLADNDLPKVHGTTRLAGVAVAFPLLADELVDFSLTLPSALKLRRLTLRYFFKEALRGFLPDEILKKKKHGFGLPFGVWLTRHPNLQQLASESLEGLAGRDIVRPEFVADLVKHRVHEHPGYYGEMVWILMMLEQWMRAYEYRRAIRPLLDASPGVAAVHA